MEYDKEVNEIFNYNNNTDSRLGNPDELVRLCKFLDLAKWYEVQNFIRAGDLIDLYNIIEASELMESGGLELLEAKK